MKTSERISDLEHAHTHGNGLEVYQIDELFVLLRAAQADREPAENWRAVVATERDGEGKWLRAVYDKAHGDTWARIGCGEEFVGFTNACRTTDTEAALAVRRAVIARMLTEEALNVAWSVIDGLANEEHARPKLGAAILAAAGAPRVEVEPRKMSIECNDATAGQLLAIAATREDELRAKLGAEKARADAAEAALNSIADVEAGAMFAVLQGAATPEERVEALRSAFRDAQRKIEALEQKARECPACEKLEKAKARADASEAECGRLRAENARLEMLVRVARDTSEAQSAELAAMRRVVEAYPCTSVEASYEERQALASALAALPTAAHRAPAPVTMLARTDGPHYVAHHEHASRRLIIQPIWRGTDGDTDDLVSECKTVAGAITLDATALPIEFVEMTASAFGILISVCIDVPNRDKESLEWMGITRAVGCPWEVLKANGAAYLVSMLRETIANLMAHEVAESMTYSGRRVFDPHRIGGAP